jgi:hypothetical protein
MTDEGEPSYKMMLGRIRMMHVVRGFFFKLRRGLQSASGLIADDAQKESVTKRGDAGELLVAPEKLRSIARFGGITYSRSTQ